MLFAGDDFANLAEFFLAIEETKKRRLHHASLNADRIASSNALLPYPGEPASSHDMEISTIVPSIPGAAADVTIAIAADNGKQSRAIADNHTGK